MPKVVATVMSCQPPLAGVGRYEYPVDINCAMRESACPEVSVDGVSRSGEGSLCCCRTRCDSS